MSSDVSSLCSVTGLAVCLFGGRFTRLYCFVLGFMLGTSFVYWFFESSAAVRHGGIPFIVGLLVSLFSGVLCLLLHMFTITGLLAFTCGSLLLVLDNGMFFQYYRTLVYLVALVCAGYYTFRRPAHSLIVTTAMSGALILTLSIDSYATRSFGALIFQETFLEFPLEVESSVARCFNWRCWILVPFWIICAMCGYATQTFHQSLRLYEQAWPLLFVTPKRANFRATPSGFSAASSRAGVSEGLLGEDRNYAISNYASYENYHKIQAAQQQQSAFTSSLHGAGQQPPAQTQPTAAPELGSAHADDKASAPVARAAFNFMETKRLPPQYQYLYVVIMNSFQGLVRAYGFQADNMQNQYEHLIFLLTNYQNKPTVLATGLAPSSSGNAPTTPTPVSVGSDYISQLHTRLFTNYREWIAYMNMGGNSTVGGSAISTDVVPLVRSQIADAKVDKNTTDAKIEEICLWLLVWGEAGTLRHTPECMMYLFHNLSAENRRYHEKFGGGQFRTAVKCSVFCFASDILTLSFSVSNPSGALDTPASSHVHRPRRAPGDFLNFVIKPIYDVLRAENSKPDGVRRNYDDINEFFWRKSCLTYYYAHEKYRVPEGGADVEGGASTASTSSPTPNSSVSISVGLSRGKKSFLEKRSWIHPARSFMRLISFYGVCFHLLVAVAYIHYAQLPLLGSASNQILSSFVVSLAGWSLVKEFVEIWATYGIISESVWNTIGFIMRLALKMLVWFYLVLFYTWAVENENPVLRDEYYQIYIILSCVYLLPLGVTTLTQLFPTLGHRIQSAKLPFVDEALKFWYPIQKAYVGRDIHEPEKDIYKYQVFWVLLLLWKMYMSLLFQVSPLIQPTVDILRHIDTLSISTHLWMKYLNYMEIVLLWLPFILVYMFDTVIWYFLWQAIMGVIVGMNVHLGEIREFAQLIACFGELPKQFDRKITYSKNKMGVGQPISATSSRSKRSPSSSNRSSPQLHPIGESSSLLTVGAGGSLVANSGAGGYQSGGSMSANSGTPNLNAPLSTARGRRGSTSGIAAFSGFNEQAVAMVDPFRNRAWENFAVVWNEIIEDLRTGDLLSNAERSLLKFRFDTTSQKEYYLPLFLMVGHVDAAIEKCVGAHSSWKSAHSTTEGGMDAFSQTKRERDLWDQFVSNPVRRECVSEVWEHVEWLLNMLLGERHASAIAMVLSSATELFITQQHLLRASNFSGLPKVKQDLLNLVRGLRIASASFATMRLAEAARDRRSIEEQEREEAEREEQRREELEREAEEEERQRREEELKDAGAVTVQDDSDSDTESGRSSSSSRPKQSRSSSRKNVIREAERSSMQGSLARAREFDLKSMLKSPSTGTLNMLEKLQSRPRFRSAAFVPGTGAASSSDDTGYLILHISLIRDQLSALLNSLAACLDVQYNANLDSHSNHASTSTSRPNPDVSQIVSLLKAVNTAEGGFMWDGAYAGKQIHAFLKNPKTNTVLSTVHSLLTIASLDAEPKSLEAIRRLLFFANSLFMDLPVAPSVRSMKSLSTLTPFHSEDIIYSYSDLEKKTGDGVSVFLYLQTIYPSEWQNFLQRVGISEDAFNTSSGGSILSNNKKWNLEARLWATMRGQTLGRTVDGMMLYEKALKLLLKLEEPETSFAASHGSHETDEASLLVQNKYNYVVSAQVYGKQRRENDPKANDIDFLLHRYPSLRVAYIDSFKVPSRLPNGQTTLTEEFYSILIKSERSPTGSQEIKEVYRIKLPGNPVLGEGQSRVFMRLSVTRSNFGC